MTKRESAERDAPGCAAFPMHTKISIDPVTSRAATSRGHCLAGTRLSLVRTAYERFKGVEEGEVADYIPPSPGFRRSSSACPYGRERLDAFGWRCGLRILIQSVSKPFVFALVCEALGEDVAREKLGVNSTGLPFNSVMAIELNDNRTMNAMVNAGAIAAPSLAPGSTAEEKWEFIQEGLSKFADAAFPWTAKSMNLSRQQTTETADRQTARGIRPHVLRRARGDRDLYKQCSLNNGERSGRHGGDTCRWGCEPNHQEKVISDLCCKRVLAVLATAGLYELSGEWLYELVCRARAA